VYEPGSSLTEWLGFVLDSVPVGARRRLRFLLDRRRVSWGDGAMVPAMAPVAARRVAVGPSHVLSGAALLAVELSEIARGIRGLDILRRSVDRAPPV
jgi:hypothetical protein